MKNLFLLLIVMFALNNSNAQLRQLTYQTSSIFGTGYSTQNFGVCGSPGARTFRVAYNHCPEYGNVDCIGGCGANPIRYTIQLQRNGTTISSQTFQASSVWSNTFFYSVTASAGNYRAYVKVERRKSGCIFGWETVSSGYTNTISATTAPATPNFNVNGTAIPTSGYITTCISNIRLNAAATTCETSYYVGVQESNQWWSRTYEYEWGGWIAGQAPNNINLQGLATTFGVGSRYIGTDASREGSILIGGNLSSGQARFYRVNVCTATPSWECKTALIRVDPNCRIDPNLITEDTNEYVWIDNPELADALKLDNIETSFEADVADSDALTTLDEQESATVRVLPNPFNSTATVQVDHYDGDAPILFEVYNTIGERVQSIQSDKTQFELSRNQLTSGIYLYRAMAGDKLLGSGKVVIE